MTGRRITKAPTRGRAASKPARQVRRGLVNITEQAGGCPGQTAAAQNQPGSVLQILKRPLNNQRQITPSDALREGRACLLRGSQEVFAQVFKVLEYKP